MPNSKSKAGEATWVVLGQFGGALGALAGVKLLTSSLRPEIYGELGLALTAATLAQQVVMGPLAGAVFRFVGPAVQEGQHNQFMIAVSRIAWSAARILLALALVVTLSVSLTGHTGRVAIIMIAFGYASLLGLTSVVENLLSGLRRRSAVAIHQCLGQLLRPMMGAVFVIILGEDSTNAICGFLIVALALLLSEAALVRVYLRAVPVGPTRPSGESIRRVREQLIEYGWPFALWGITTWAQMATERWSIEFANDRAGVGLYQAAYQVGYLPMALGATAMMQFMMPLVFEKVGDGRDPARIREQASRINSYALWALGLTVVAAVTSLPIRHRVFQYFTGSRYSAASDVLPLMILSGGVFGVGQICSVSLLTERTSKALIVPKVVTAMAGVGLNFLFASLWGWKGVAASSMMFSTMYCSWTMALCQQKWGRKAVGT